MRLLLCVFVFAVFAFQPLYAEAKNSARPLIVETFAKLKPKQQDKYIKGMQAAFKRFEESSMRKSGLHVTEANRGISFSLISAFADETPVSMCVVGAQMDPPVTGPNGKLVCSTMNHPCNGNPDSYQCGTVNANACVPRQPIASLSARCYEAGRTTESLVKIKANYSQFKAAADELIQKACPSEGVHRNPDGCVSLDQSVRELNRDVSSASVDAVESAGVGEAGTTAAIQQVLRVDSSCEWIEDSKFVVIETKGSSDSCKPESMCVRPATCGGNVEMLACPQSNGKCPKPQACKAANLVKKQQVCATVGWGRSSCVEPAEGAVSE